MPINVRAAVAHAPGKPLTIENLVYDDPIGNEVLFKILATGLCHSDLSYLDGVHHGVFPVVLGHEAAGVVAACGPDVTELKPGDHVIPLFMPECRKCSGCTSGKTNICVHAGHESQSPAKLRMGEQLVRRNAGIATFADFSIAPEYQLAKVRTDAPLDRIFYVGCGVTTGVGAVVFQAKVEVGSSVVVIGIGGIGLNVLQGARLAGALKIIAVDTNPAREQMARSFGATEFVNPLDFGDGVAAHLKSLTAGGADYTFECVGNTKLMRLASDASHPRWGLSTFIGAPPTGHEVAGAPFDFLYGRKWQGTLFGGAKGRRDVPKIVDWYMEGKLKIDELVTHELPLERINEGFDLMRKGESIRTVIRLD